MLLEKFNKRHQGEANSLLVDSGSLLEASQHQLRQYCIAKVTIKLIKILQGALTSSLIDSTSVSLKLAISVENDHSESTIRGIVQTLNNCEMNSKFILNSMRKSC